MRRLIIILLLVLLIPVLVLVTVSSTVNMQLSPWSPSSRSVPLVTDPPITVENPLTVEELASAYEQRLAELYPDGYKFSLEGNDLLVGVYLSPETDEICLEEANRGELSTWYSLSDPLIEASGQWYQTFEANGHPEIKVHFSYYRPTDYGDRILGRAVNGYLIYDFYQDVAVSAAQTGSSYSYVLNLASGVFHRTSCGIVSQIDPANRLNVSSARENLIAQGFRPCGQCNP